MTRPDRQQEEDDHLWPEFLPNGCAVLFTIVDRGNFRIAALGWPGGQRKALIPSGTWPRYVETGHIVYGLAGAVNAAPFDAGRLQVTGPSVPMIDKVLTKVSGAVDFAVSRDGVAIYLTASAQPEQSLVWVARDGSEQPAIDLGRQTAARPRLSPRDTHVALQVDNDIWVYDLGRRTRTRVTFSGRSQDPVWTPDGTRLVFGNDVRGGNETDLFWAPWDASTQPEPLLVREHSQDPHAWSPDGRALAFHERAGGNRDLWILKLDPKPHAEPLLVTRFNERSPMFSPDGHWLAYASDESGRDEIYVRPYPGPGGRQVISAGGGTEPIWSRSGRELFYRNGNKVVAVQVQTAGGFSVGVQRVLFEGPYAIETAGTGSLSYDVSADGQRFLMMKVSRREGEEVDPHVNVIENWFEELRRLVPTN